MTRLNEYVHIFPGCYKKSIMYDDSPEMQPLQRLSYIFHFDHNFWTQKMYYVNVLFLCKATLRYIYLFFLQF